jgi:hypothetical protein
MVTTKGSRQKPPQRHRDSPWSDRTVDKVVALAESGSTWIMRGAYGATGPA